MSLDFNPRTREGCDYCDGGLPLGEALISIHAPVKGATPWVNDSIGDITGFQSTHP